MHVQLVVVKLTVHCSYSQISNSDGARPNDRPTHTKGSTPCMVAMMHFLKYMSALNTHHQILSSRVEHLLPHSLERPRHICFQFVCFTNMFDVITVRANLYYKLKHRMTQINYLHSPFSPLSTCTQWYEELQQVAFNQQFPAKKGPLINSSMEYVPS